MLPCSIVPICMCIRRSLRLGHSGVLRLVVAENTLTLPID